MELIDLIPNSMSFRIITTLDVDDEADIPDGFTGRVRRSQRGRVIYVAWYRNGKLENPAKNHPAYRRFRSNRELKYELWYSEGMLHDPNDHTAAVRGYYANGVVHYEEHYQHGRRNDSPSGRPAITKWRQDGTLRHELRYLDGIRVA